MKSGFRFDASTQTFVPDISQITLFCENQKVGSCEIDLVPYIDKQVKIEKAMIAGTGSFCESEHSQKRALIGD